MNKSISILSLMIILLIVSCSSAKNVLVNSKLDKDTITISKNDTLTVELISNASTGYRWFLDSTLKYNNIILLKEKNIPPTTDLIGAAGKQAFVFKATKKGEINLNFYYVRVNLDTAKTKTIQIKIN